MSAYLYWSLRQLYLLLFWPTLHEAEVGSIIGKDWRSRLCYMLKATPLMVCAGATQAIAAIVILWLVTGKPIIWGMVLAGVCLGWIAGIATGIQRGVRFGVIFAIQLSMMFAAFGINFDSDHLRTGTGFGLAFGITMGLSLAFGRRPSIAANFGVIAGMGGGLILGLVGAIGGGITAGFTISPKVGLMVGLTFLMSFFLAFFRLPEAPLWMLMSWWLGIKSDRQMANPDRLWKWHPLSWHELVWVPLPGAARFLANLVKADHLSGFQRIAFVAAHRPLQERAVSNALCEVMLHDLHLDTFSQFSQVAHKLEWLAEPPGRLPQTAIKFGPIFHRVAQRAAQCLALSSVEQQAQILSQSLIELDSLRKKLVGTPGPVASELLKKVERWRLLFGDEFRRANDSRKSFSGIPAVYQVGSYLTEKQHHVFFGREQERQQLDAFIKSPSPPSAILLLGSRRMGKSSFLQQLPLLLGPDCVRCFMDMQNTSCNQSLPQFFATLSRLTVQELQKSGIATARLEVGQLRTETFAVFDEWLRETEAVMRSEQRLLICFDEYERMNDLARDSNWKLLDYLRYLQQQHRKLILLYCGAHPFHALGAEWASRFVSARTMRLSYLDRESSVRLLTTPRPEFPLTYEPDALEHMLTMTHCQPFFLQALAEELILLLNFQERKHATIADINGAIVRTAERWCDHIASIWLGASPDGQHVMVEALAERPVTDSAALRTLVEQDVIYRDGRFQVPAFGRWLKLWLETQSNQLGIE